MTRAEALACIRENSSAHHTKVDWPVAIRAALVNSRGGMLSPERHRDVLHAIGVLTGLPFEAMISDKDAAAAPGDLEVCVRALREITRVRGQQGSEARRMAQGALLAIGEDTSE